MSILNRFLAIAVGALLSCAITWANADSTWSSNPATNDWNTASNWVPADVPNGTGDTASFGTSTITQISNAVTITLAGMVFDPGASAYTVTGNFSFFLNGVVNQSGVTQNIVLSDTINFNGSCTAGSDVVYTDHGFAFGYGVGFYDTSSAESATFINDGDEAYGAWLHFDDQSSAADCVIINQGDVGAVTDFFDSSSAGNSVILANANSQVAFSNFATGANSALTADEGNVVFQGSSTGGAAQLQLINGGNLDLISHDTRTLMSLGSLGGDSTAFVSLGGQQLTVGGNGLNTTFSGVISGGGSLAKVGAERLILTGSNTYRGGTTVTGGTLIAQARTGSATGSGAVKVNAGTLAGKGTLSGTVTVGTGTGAGAFLAPGTKGPDTLTSSKALTFKADGRYKCDLSLGQAKADQVNANGVTIESSAQFVLQPKGFQTLMVGTVFTVINNTAATAISGTFANLSDGAIINATAGNRLQASYTGGNGNDLTLTVVP